MRANATTPILGQIAKQVVRVAGAEVTIRMDEEFEPAVGPLIEVAFDGAYWHLFPEGFLDLLRELPSGAGGDAVRQAIEQKAQHVWHGPAPPSRDTADPT